MCSGLPESLLPLGSLYTEPFQQVQLLPAPVPLSDLELEHQKGINEVILFVSLLLLYYEHVMDTLKIYK